MSVEAIDSTVRVPRSDSQADPFAEPRWYARARWPRRILMAFAIALLAAGPNLIDDPTRTRQWAEYLCYAVIAVGLDIVWGYGGMLALGQGVFFGLGAYAMGMYLSLEQVEAGQLPEFMRLYSDYDSLPWLWQPFQHLWLTVTLGVLVPVLVAGLGGWLVFRRRIRGPYFAILTQASALVFWLLLVGQLMLTAGTNGLTNFQTVFGRNKYEEATPTFLYYLAAGLLVVAVLMANLRDVDVICRLDAARVAVALDAVPADARSVARRVHKLLSQTFVFDATWVGMATASPDLESGRELLDAAIDALERARLHPAGGIVAAP